MKTWKERWVRILVSMAMAIVGSVATVSARAENWACYCHNNPTLYWAYLSRTADARAAGIRFQEAEQQRMDDLSAKYAIQSAKIRDDFEAYARAVEDQRRQNQAYQQQIASARSAMYSEPAHPRLQLHTMANRPSEQVGRSLVERLPRYFEEAHALEAKDSAKEVTMRTICFPKGMMSVDSSPVANDVVQEVVSLARSAERAGSVISVLGLASHTGPDHFNEMLSWGRAANVKAAITQQAGGASVFAAGVFRSGLTVDPRRFKAWFGENAQLAPGVGSEVERANQCVAIVVLPPNSLFHAILDLLLKGSTPT